MRIIAHLSDLHFGRTDPRVVQALIDDLNRHRPDLVLVSGDLTQRARTYQFAEARDFLSRLPAPALVVPGNHDLPPLYRPFSRMFRPRARFHRHLPGHAPWPLYRDEGLIALGLDSTRAWRWKEGKLRDSHLERIGALADEAAEQTCLAVFLHHPLRPTPRGHPFQILAGRGVDLILTGHHHRTEVRVIAGDQTGSSLLVQASSACSTRLRGEANGYGLIAVEMPRLDIRLQGWNGETFHTVRHEAFVKTAGLWQPAAG